ncbi:ABC transporter [Streptomyces phaeoluteigriseus]|uniref:ABC transporter n=1 Tax=Streptomyces phaeoluteigriseus TaxID=114686 RepID=UPI0025AC1ED9|nr:ABC transporter [Streptomyces phaeoluteigriseus]
MRRVGDAAGAEGPASGRPTPSHSDGPPPSYTYGPTRSDSHGPTVTAGRGPTLSTGRGPTRRTRALLRSLAPPVWRSLPWAALTAGGGLGLLFAASTRLPDQAPGEELGLTVLRVTALTGGVGLAFLLDDPARHTTVASPLGRPYRAGLRLAMAAPLLALWWMAALILLPGPTRPPLVPVTLEALATATFAIALATAAVRFTDGAEVGKRAAAWLGAAAAVAVLVPARWGLLTLPADRWWEETHVRWALVLAVTLASTALCTPEPLRRRSVRLSPSGGL